MSINEENKIYGADEIPVEEATEAPSASTAEAQDTLFHATEEGQNAAGSFAAATDTGNMESWEPENTPETELQHFYFSDPKSALPSVSVNSDESESDEDYSLKRDELSSSRSYIDASYQIGREMETPKPYYTPPKKIERKPQKRRSGMGGFIAACLVCAIIGGIGGGALVASKISGQTPAYPPATLNISTGNTTPSPGPAAVASGERLTGTDIFALGCDQAVGVTTEITYRNYFGAESSSAVSGSGFIVTDNGYIVTNYHVIQAAYEGGYEVSVLLYNGESFKADIVGFEKDQDLAVLKINVEGLPAALLGDSDTIRVGDAAYAIGNPLGELNFSMSSGSVSALNRQITTYDEMTGKQITNHMFQIDAAVNSGNSGGPVYNDRGEVVGIVTAKYADAGVEGLGFALPINDVIKIIGDLVEFGYVTGKPIFGISAQTVSNVSASYYNLVAGAEVKVVNPGSCAERGGILVGDIITAIDSKLITSSDELIAAKNHYSPGDTVTITVYRDGGHLDLQVTFDEDTGTLIPDITEKDRKIEIERDKLPIVPKTE